MESKRRSVDRSGGILGFGLSRRTPVRVSGEPTVPLRDITSCVPQHWPS
jgi:hypothetical protein